MRLNFTDLTEPVIQPVLADNQMIQAQLLGNIIMTSVLIRYIRANSNNELKTSVIKSAPCILSYVIGTDQIDWPSVLGLNFCAHEPSMGEIQHHPIEELPADLDDLELENL